MLNEISIKTLPVLPVAEVVLGPATAERATPGAVSSHKEKPGT